MDGVDSHANMGVNGQCVQLLCLTAWEGGHCTCMHVAMGVLSMVCMYGLTVDRWDLWSPTGT